MSHDHHDHRSLGITSLNKAFVIGIVLNAGFVVAEFIAGFWYNSLGLISDAGHNLGDVFSLVLAMLAFRLAKVSPTLRYTYGYKKSTILVSLLNAVILLVAVGFILGESIDKLFHPRPVDGDAVAWVAGVGVLVNALTAWLFVKDKEKDLNVKGARNPTHLLSASAQPRLLLERVHRRRLYTRSSPWKDEMPDNRIRWCQSYRAPQFQYPVLL